MDKPLTETEKILQKLDYKCPKCGHPIQRGNRSEIQCERCGLIITVSTKYNRLIGYIVLCSYFGSLFGFVVGFAVGLLL
jgi:DNA-directed RNA polymerase subunit RPC12/RpoP